MVDLKYPKYYLIMENLIKMIEKEEIQAGEAIPPERELVTKYNVSRITVRKAIEELVAKGYLYRVQGKGTYVKQKSITQGLIKLTSCTEDIKRNGMEVGIKVIDSKIVLADKKISKRLGIKPDEKVYKMRRVFYGDNRPINITTSYVNYKYVEGIEKNNFSSKSMYGIIENDYGINIIKANRTIEAILSKEEYSKELKISDGQPLLYFKGEVYATNNYENFILEYFETVYVTEFCKFYLEQFR